MKRIVLLMVAVSALVFTSCNDNDGDVSQPVQAVTITNFHAPQNADYTVNPPVISGDFVKFSFKEGKKVTGDNWDIAFRGTRILVNGGSVIGLTDEPARTGKASLALVSSAFADVKTAPTDTEFKQDASKTYALPHGTGNGWYTYAGGVITRIAGKVIVVKTVDGNYAKMSIKSYYKDEDSTNNANARYYTFDYVYNPNVGDKSFQ
ncbi:HmuY family protein [uncultured Tenacibaculum sp.]|uniref:HmuY family protein n=1 Tax=uncultured Tenacibaculum sp. TaxID=174713 RepID=UPI0026214D76|nr:HmuY family protein [uncultured Tenacibaculum sp.]